jgi:type I protein arginine methyltransferase
MYSVSGYSQMNADEVRMRAYSRALQLAVRRDSVVIDIGAGTGILSLLACRYGARKVYSIEPSSAIEVARESARANGFADRVECICALSTETTLREKADVIVSDLRGALPLFGRHLPSIIDARRRFLAPGGKLIPQRDLLWAAVVEAPADYDRLTSRWVRQYFGLNMDAASQIATNRWKKVRIKADQLLSRPYCWSTMDYVTVASSNVSAEAKLPITRSGTAHGFAIWFDSVLDDGIEFSNAPGQPELIYGSGFFPWSSPVKLEREDTVCMNVGANLISSDYVWSWETRIYRKGACTPASHFRQSTFLGTPISKERLQKRAGRYLPKLKVDGQVDLRILEMIDGTRTNSEIVQDVMGKFPSHFASEHEALTRVADIVERYSC